MSAQYLYCSLLKKCMPSGLFNLNSKPVVALADLRLTSSDAPRADFLATKLV